MKLANLKNPLFPLRTLAVCLGLTIFILDLLTKWLVHSTAWLQYYPVIEGFFTINYVRNEGVAFGLFHSLESEWKVTFLLFIGIAAVIVTLYYIWTFPTNQPLPIISLGLLLGGILGNLVDRFLNHYVIDFLTIHWKNYFSWPTFNLADMAITCGVFLIFYTTFFPDSNPEAKED